MASDLITVFSSALPSSSRVVAFRGVEAISRPYEIEIFLTVPQELGDELDPEDAIGAKARLVIDRTLDLAPPFVFAGVLASVEILHAHAGKILLRAALVPQLWQLGLSRHSRNFTKVTVADLLHTLLRENGITRYELRLGAHPTEEHVCQYRESDLDFLSRWMEREGLYYFFEHGEDGETLIVCDAKPYEKDKLGPPVRFYPQVGHDHSAGPSLRTFTARHTTLPLAVKLKDYDYAKPGLKVAGAARVAENGAGEISLYGDRFFTPGEGDRLAKLRAEELRARRAVYRGVGTRMHLRPGFTFELEEHPLAGFNAEYLTVEARHHGNQAAGLEHFRELIGMEKTELYLVEVDAIPAETQFRAERVTPWPRVYGYENGTVEGPAESEYAQIDDQGRYNVKFKYDESALKGQRASTFVRMMQPHGGDVEGFHFPLRKGTEVMVSFLGGDPDRPVIAGVVPNAHAPSKVVAQNHTQNIIQTGSGSYLTVEDKGGAEYINLYSPQQKSNLYLGAPRPDGAHALTRPNAPDVPPEGRRPVALGPFCADLRTGGSGQISTGGNLDVHAGGQLQVMAHGATTIYSKGVWHVDVDAAADEHYWATFAKTVEAPVTVHYKNTLTYDVDQKATEHYHQALERTVDAATKITYGNGLDRTVNAALTDEKLNAGHKLTVSGGNQDITVNGDMTDTITGARTTTVTKDWTINVSGNVQKFVSGQETKTTKGPEENIKLGTLSWSVVGLKTDLFAGGKLSVTVGAQSSLTLGFKFDFNGAVNFKTYGVKSTVEGFEDRVAGATNRLAGAVLRSMATGMEAYGMSMMPAGFRIM